MYKNSYFRGTFHSDVSRILKIYCKFIPLGENESRTITTQTNTMNTMHSFKEKSLILKSFNKLCVNHIDSSHSFSNMSLNCCKNKFYDFMLYQLVSKNLLYTQVHKLEIPTHSFLAPNDRHLILRRNYVCDSGSIPQRTRIKDYKKRKSKMPPLCKACPRKFTLKKNTTFLGWIWSKLGFDNGSNGGNKKGKCTVTKKKKPKHGSGEKTKPPIMAQPAACVAECDLRKTDSSSTCQMKPKPPEPKPNQKSKPPPCIESKPPCVELKPPCIDSKPPCPAPIKVCPETKPQKPPTMDEKMAALCKKYNLDDIWLSDNVSSEKCRPKPCPTKEIIPCVKNDLQSKGEKSLSKTPKKKSRKNPDKLKQEKMKQNNNEKQNKLCKDGKENPKLYSSVLPLVSQGHEDQKQFEEQLTQSDSIDKNEQKQSEAETQKEINEVNKDREYNNDIQKSKINLDEKVEKFIKNQLKEGNYKKYKQYSINRDDEDDNISEPMTSRCISKNKSAQPSSDATANTSQKHSETDSNGINECNSYDENAQFKHRSGSFRHYIKSAESQYFSDDYPRQSFIHEAMTATTKRKINSESIDSPSVDSDIDRESRRPLTKRQLLKSDDEKEISSRTDDLNKIQQKIDPTDFDMLTKTKNGMQEIEDNNVRPVRSTKYDPESQNQVLRYMEIAPQSDAMKPELRGQELRRVEMAPQNTTMREQESGYYEKPCISNRRCEIPNKQDMNSQRTPHVTNSHTSELYEIDKRMEMSEPLKHYRYWPTDNSTAVERVEKYQKEAHTGTTPIDLQKTRDIMYNSNRRSQTVYSRNFLQNQEQMKRTFKQPETDSSIRYSRTVPHIPPALEEHRHKDPQRSSQFKNPEIPSNREVISQDTDKSPNLSVSFDDTNNAFKDILCCKFDITQDEPVNKSLYKTNVETENKQYQLRLTLSECDVKSDNDSTEVNLNSEPEARTPYSDNQKGEVKFESVESSLPDRNSRNIINETKTTQDRIRNFTTSAHQKIEDAEMEMEVYNLKDSNDKVTNQAKRNSMVLPKMDEIQNFRMASNSKQGPDASLLKQYSTSVNDMNLSSKENVGLKDCFAALQEFKSLYCNQKGGGDDLKLLNSILESKNSNGINQITSKYGIMQEGIKTEDYNGEMFDENYRNILESVLRSYGIHNAGNICNTLETNDNYENFQDMEVKYDIENGSYGATGQKDLATEEVEQPKPLPPIFRNKDRSDTVKTLKNKKSHKVIHKGQTQKNPVQLKRKRQKAKTNEQSTQYVVDSTMLAKFIKLIKKDLVGKNTFKKCAGSCCNCNLTDKKDCTSCTSDYVPVSCVKGNKKIKLEVPSEISKHFGQMEDRFKIISPCDVNNAEKLHILLSHKAQEFSKVMVELVKLFSSYKTSNELLKQEDTIKYLQNHQCRIESLKDTVKSLQDSIGKYFMECNKKTETPESNNDFAYNNVKQSNEIGTTDNMRSKKLNMNIPDQNVTVYGKDGFIDSTVLSDTRENLNVSQRNNTYLKEALWEESESEDEFRKTLLDLVHLLSNSETGKQNKLEMEGTKLHQQ